ncbi:hypothetical protein ACTFIZ_007512 [Dictyostelium cf. discoideum]
MIDSELKIIVPQVDEVIQLVISSYHDSALTGHWSVRKTTELVKRNFYWYGMVENITHYCKSCKVYLCTTLRCSSKDHGLSKFVVLIPIPKHTTSIQVINQIQDQVFFTFGMPSIIIDNDPLFTSWKRCIQANNIVHNTCLPYYRQGNGQAEIMKDWVSYLKSVQFCINKTVSESTSFTLFQVLTDIVQQNPVDSIERSRQQYNKNKSPNILVEGDIVYLQELNTGAHPI